MDSFTGVGGITPAAECRRRLELGRQKITCGHILGAERNRSIFFSGFEKYQIEFCDLSAGGKLQSEPEGGLVQTKRLRAAYKATAEGIGT